MLTLNPIADQELIALMAAKLQAAVEAGADKARDDCPVQTGRLLYSIATTKAELNYGRIESSVTADRPYAYTVEMLHHPFLSTIGPTIEEALNVQG